MVESAILLVGDTVGDVESHEDKERRVEGEFVPDSVGPRRLWLDSIVTGAVPDGLDEEGGEFDETAEDVADTLLHAVGDETSDGEREPLAHTEVVELRDPVGDPVLSPESDVDTVGDRDEKRDAEKVELTQLVTEREELWGGVTEKVWNDEPVAHAVVVRDEARLAEPVGDSDALCDEEGVREGDEDEDAQLE